MDFRPLPAEYRDLYASLQATIKQRLAEFAAVPRSEWFYELAFCILTPQSKAVSANAVINVLKARGFREEGFDPTEVLRDREHYIRFHNVKSKRLLLLREQWSEIEAILDRPIPVREKRDVLSDTVNGIGLKEASHFMRNVGFRGLAIIDRHVIRGLESCQVYVEVPKPSTPRVYHEIENTLDHYSASISMDMDELDLLFWSKITGFVLK